MNNQHLPVVVIGAGPVGLAAAAHLLERGLTPRVLEAGRSPGSSLAGWGHVRMFSPWEYNLDPVCRRLLEHNGWVAPPAERYPTGGELLERYVEPLAGIPELAPYISYGHRVTGVGRLGLDRLQSRGRETVPFDVAFDHGETGGRLQARAVIDASGTWATPSPLGAGGLPAVGEREARDRIFYRLPDITGSDRERFADRHVLVVGGGDSAFTAVTQLALLAQTRCHTRITWAIRSTAAAYGGGVADQLPERGALGRRVSSLVAEGRVELVTRFQVREIAAEAGGLTVGAAGGTLRGIDVVIAATGFRPDHSLAGELRLSLDPGSESVGALGPLIDPNVHSCGTVPPHGVDELRHPDYGYFIVGMKSYGRAPTFLLLTGYEQVRSVVAALAGDWEAAREVRLTLPETGVCASAAAPEVESGCCDGVDAETAVGRAEIPCC